MVKKSRGLLLTVLVATLLVVISSRISPVPAAAPGRVTVTDDPLPQVTETAAPADWPSMPTATPLNIHEILPGVSKSDWNLRLVNQTYLLSASFAPDVTAVEDGQYFSTAAADELNAMLEGARAAGYTVCIRTAYRPFSTQAYLFNGKASQIQWGTNMSLIDAETKARKIVAYPGTSEHQLGLCTDLMDSADTTMDAETAAELPVLKWLAEHCAEYGFILRYPEEKRDVTGWYEPWHFRYVGQECAEYIMENGLCLEEFLSLF